MSGTNNKCQQREYVGEAFYTAPSDIVAQMRALEAELDELHDQVRGCADSAQKTDLLERQKKLEESMELMSQLLCFAKKV